MVYLFNTCCGELTSNWMRMRPNKRTVVLEANKHVRGDPTTDYKYNGRFLRSDYLEALEQLQENEKVVVQTKDGKGNLELSLNGTIVTLSLHTIPYPAVVDEWGALFNVPATEKVPLSDLLLEH